MSGGADENPAIRTPAVRCARLTGAVAACVSRISWPEGEGTDVVVLVEGSRAARFAPSARPTIPPVRSLDRFVAAPQAPRGDHPEQLPLAVRLVVQRDLGAVNAASWGPI